MQLQQFCLPSLSALRNMENYVSCYGKEYLATKKCNYFRGEKQDAKEVLCTGQLNAWAWINAKCTKANLMEDNPSYHIQE